MVEDKVNGFAVPPKDEGALADAIERIFRDDDMANKMGNAGWEKSKYYDWEVLVDRTEEVFRSAIEERG